MTKLFDVGDLHKTAESLGMLRPIVAPQIAESLAAMDFGKMIAETSPKLEPPAFKFLSLADLGLGKQLATAFQTADLTKVFGTRLDELAQSLPRTFPHTIAPSFIPRVEAAAEEAVILAAEDDAVAEIVGDAPLDDFEALTPAQQRMLALDVAVLVAALLVLAAWLAESGDPKDPKGAAIALTCAAALVRVLWRATGKI
jgi:hypothetical protein